MRVIVFLCLQSPQKYLPSDDHLYPEIAAHVDRAVFVFLEGGSRIFEPSIFKARLSKAFAKHDLELDRYVKFLPHLSQEQYQSLNRLGDIALDTPGWSGGNTTLEALYQDLPLVTLNGSQMRACVSAGIMQLIGVEETIATSKQEYVEIAVRLGKDTNWRNSIADKISNSKIKLETDMSSIRAMEDFLEKKIRDRTEPSIMS